MHKFLVALILSTPLASVLDAQCTTTWQPGSRVPGVDGEVNAMIRWDPDGPGPATPVLVLAGEFRAAGNRVASNIASYDPATGAWGAFGAGTDGAVHSLAVLPGGELVAGGSFRVAGGLAASGIAAWNGSLWLPMGIGLQGTVRALATAANGDLYAGGQIFGAGFAPLNIARWSGGNWSVVGGGLDLPVSSLAALPNGDVVAGGEFQSAGGTAVEGLARWNGNSWAPIGTGLSPYPWAPSAGVSVVKVLANGDLVVGGAFERAGGGLANGFALWNGISWTGFGAGPPQVVYSIAELPPGDLVIGGFLDLPGAPNCSLARWSAGQGWSPLLTESSQNRALLVDPSGALFVGGTFTSIGGTFANAIARYNGLTWTALATGTGGTFSEVFASKVLRNGEVVIGGSFAQIDGVAANNVARWNGSSWSPLGLGVNGPVYAIEELPNGELAVGGEFNQAGGQPAALMARWNGTTWSAMPGLDDRGQTNPYYVLSLAVLPNGDLVAGGGFSGANGMQASNLAVWDGTSWSPFTLGTDGWVTAMAVMPNGDLVISGWFTQIYGVAAFGIARWNGTAWSPLGPGGPFRPSALAAMPNGDLLAGGGFFPSHEVARWDGSSWTRLGPGFDFEVLTLRLLPDGDLLAGGAFVQVGGVPMAGIARWGGASWNPVDSGCNGIVRTLALLPDGDVLAGGSFTVAGGQVSSRLARLRSTCPATAVATGTGCSGSAGTVQLRATSLPWLGSTFRSQATGLPANAVALEIRGLSTTALPLPAVLPQGVAGCTLQVTPDLLGLVVPSQGTASSAFSIPNSLGLVGAVLHQQIAPLEFGASGNLTAVTSSNALRLVLGVF
ncbi:MAG: WD40 repeat domain-containing protein [Planctomycetes bacterium]|nr:WD40 repeat domain-containing protein [Planctomycetota bacterium]